MTFNSKNVRLQLMIKQEHQWKIDSEWTMSSGHFRYYFVISNDLSIDVPQKIIKGNFVDYMKEMYGTPGKRWGFRFDRNFDKINLSFSNQEDAIIFRLTHG